MKYAITYATDDSWNGVDTFLVESDTNPLDMTDEQVIHMFEQYIYNQEEAKRVALDFDYWFCRNINDTDVIMKGTK